MNSMKNNVIKYLGTAMAVGGAVMVGSGFMSATKRAKRKMKKSANKAIDTIEGIMNNVQGMIK